MSTHLRYGIIGCGSMGREHIENIQAMPVADGGAGVTAIADPHGPSRDAARALCRGEPRVFADPRELLASGLCDAVVVATPNHTHVAVMRDALATDLAILVEKPLVTRIEDGVELVAREAERRRRGVRAIVWVAQEYRYMPPVAEAIRMTHEGAAGRVQQVTIREHREPFYPKVGDWNRFTANTGGTLVEKCCHYFNLMDLIVGERPLRVFASGGQRVNHLDEDYGGRRPDILDSAYAIVEYPGGARAMLELCMFAENSVDSEHLTIVGDEGKIESLLPSLTLRYGRRADWGRRAVWGEPSGTGRGVSVRRVWDTAIRYPGHHFGASYLEHLRFADAVRHGKPAEIPLDEGLRAVATGLAAHRSIDEGRAVALSEILPAGA
ncbi:MAG: Gfo/Idh/MocA family oxidoreductase [Betaproteobacteria bacterium]|nr:Gfo/Idh/MocA family oxidoreductase [Betaproteobacteria bacterium]MCC7217872.1 Gfo/Idh/MocA family oxidoreductase [Burkholderiales bacterium]